MCLCENKILLTNVMLNKQIITYIFTRQHSREVQSRISIYKVKYVLY